jgi:hypothetical protein
MPTKKKPSVKQLAARAKFVKMVRAKAAKSKLAKKKTVAKIVKKKTVKKAAKKKTIKQTGTSNKVYDKRFSAKPPGKRKSKSGNIYTEKRANHSDKGRLLGINNNVVGKFFALEEYKKKLFAIKNFENIISKIKSSLPTVKYKHTKDALKKELVYVKKMFAEYKTHARELKKLV